MFKKQKGNCVSCGHYKLLVVKAGYCNYCNETVRKNKNHKPLSRSPIIRGNKNAKANNDFYEKAWKEWSKKGKIFCMECGYELKTFSPSFVAHVLSRGAFDVDWIKYSMDNVIPLCQGCHYTLDSNKGCTKMEIWPWVQEKRQELKRRYYGN